mgnify:CR=1 FL=1
MTITDSSNYKPTRSSYILRSHKQYIGRNNNGGADYGKKYVDVDVDVDVEKEGEEEAAEETTTTDTAAAAAAIIVVVREEEDIKHPFISTKENDHENEDNDNKIKK